MNITRPSQKPILNFITRHSCYLLQSCSSENKTYVGYSKDPWKRLRQHNGEIVGGAKATSKFRPWRIICIISGFPDKRTALQFEWKNHHPPSKKFDLVTRIKNLSLILNLPRWTKTCLPSSLFIIRCNWIQSGFKLLSCPKNCRETWMIT